MLSEEQLIILNNLWNLNFSIFGIGVTLLTVLISFLITKKDELRVYDKLYKHQNSDVTLKGKITSAIIHIKKLRRFTYHIIVIICSSLIVYSTSWISIVFDFNQYMLYVVECTSALILIYIITLLVAAISFFWRYTKV